MQIIKLHQKVLEYKPKYFTKPTQTVFLKQNIVKIVDAIKDLKCYTVYTGLLQMMSMI